MLIMRSIWCSSDLPGSSGLFNNNSANTQPADLRRMIKQTSRYHISLPRLLILMESSTNSPYSIGLQTLIRSFDVLKSV